MRIINLILVAFLSSCMFATEKSVDEHLQIDCKIYNKELKLLTSFPGFTCQFLPNGEWVSLFGEDLNFYSKNNELKYKSPFKVHHEFSFSKDLSKIFFLSSEIKMYKNKKTRFDVINIGTAEGKLITSWSVFDHKDELMKIGFLKRRVNNLPTPMDNEYFAKDEQREFGHLNAIYEIPKNKLEITHPFLKEGNLVVTFNGLGSVIIFSQDLKNVLHVFNVLKGGLHGIHDAQILENGHLVFFKNFNLRNKKPYTTIEEYDITNQKMHWRYEFVEPTFRYNPFGGAIQVLNNNNLLITETSYGGRVLEIDRKGKIIWEKYNDSVDPGFHIPGGIFRARVLSLDQFLKNNQSANKL